LKAPGDLGPGHDLGGPGIEETPGAEPHLPAQLRRHRLHPPDDDVGRQTAPSLGQVDEHDGLVGHQAAALCTQGDFGLGADNSGLGAVDGALDLGFGPGPEHHHVVKGPGGHQGAPEPLGEHEHRRKDENHQRHARGSQERREPPGQQVTVAVRKRNGHGFSRKIY